VIFDCTNHRLSSPTTSLISKDRIGRLGGEMSQAIANSRKSVRDTEAEEDDDNRDTR